MRSMHELRAQPVGTPSAFLTLTYDPKHLPPSNSLDIPEYKNFLKRLRDKIGPGLRFLGCGEYGEKFGRPHYHFITFNYRPEDCRLLRRGDEFNYYSSERLDNIWGFGNTIIGDVSFHSCAYVARYCVKKITGPKAADHYNGRTPEFSTRSLGFGKGYFARHKDEIYNLDSIVVNGHEVRPPRYYDNLFDNIDANMYRHVDERRINVLKRKRHKLVQIPKAEKSSRRRYAKDMVIRAKLKLTGRKL